jgi:sugar lactone lactonase YvrE
MLRKWIPGLLMILAGCMGGKTHPAKIPVNEPVPSQLVAKEIYDAENLAFDPRGRLFVSASGSLYVLTGLGGDPDEVRMSRAIDLDAVFAGMALGPDGCLYVVCYHKMKSKILRIDLHDERMPYSVYLEGGIKSPNGMRFDDEGVLYAADFGFYGPGMGRILKIERDPADPARAGKVTLLVKGLWGPNGIVIDRDRERLYFTETLAGKIHYLEKTGPGGFHPEPKLLLNVDVSGPRFPILDDLALDARGDLYVSNYNGDRILVVSPKGKILRSLAPRDIRHPTALAFGVMPGDEESLYITQKGHMLVRERHTGDRLSRVEHVARPYRLPFLGPTGNGEGP